MLSKNVRFIRERRGLKQSDLAKRLGYGTGAAVSLWEKGKATPPANTLERLAKMVDVSVDELLHYDIEQLLKERKTDLRSNQSIRIPVYASVHAGIPNEAIDEVVDFEDIPQTWTTPGRKYFGVKVRGDSMSPDYRDGDTVIVEVSPSCESGSICVCRINGFDAVLRKVVINQNQTILQALNPAYEPMFFSGEKGEPTLEIGGVVRELRRSI